MTVAEAKVAMFRVGIAAILLVFPHPTRLLSLRRYEFDAEPFRNFTRSIGIITIDRAMSTIV